MLFRLLTKKSTKTLIIASFTLLSLTIFAQSQQGKRNGAGQGTGAAQAYGVISGTVHDEATNAHVEYANVILFSVKDSAMTTGTITDNKGRFTLRSINPGKYFLRIQFIGYENKDISDIQISQRLADIQLGDIKLKPKASALQGVEVTGERALITNNLDKKVIAVDKSMAIGGGTATDVMENVPSVTVDSEGNVSLRGNSNVTLLVDGKPASQAGLSSSDLLNQIPASSIESVEVITNPSVRYDPEGTTGIINLVLKKKALQGFNGMVSATAGTGDKYNGSLALNYRHSRFNAFVNFDIRKHNMTRGGESTRTSNLAGAQSVLEQDETGDMFRNNYRISGGFDYFFNTRNNITVSVAKRDMAFGFDGDLSNTTKTGDLLTRSFNRFSTSERSIDSYEYTLSYKHLYQQKGREFTNDIIFNDNAMTSEAFIDQQEYDILTGEPANAPLKQYNTSGNENKMLTLQGNYVYPMENGSRLEAGYKADVRDINMDYDYQNFIGNEWVSEPTLRNNYDYQEQIYAAYAVYANSWKKLKYQGGLRLEQVFTHSVYELGDKDVKTDYTSLYPSFHSQYDLGKNRELQLSYSRRVRRPSPREMNPYYDFSDSLNIRTGNPLLKPEYANSVELGLLQYFDRNSVTVSLFYRNTNNGVEDISYRLSEDPEYKDQIVDSLVLLNKPFNISKSSNYGLEVVGTLNPTTWLRTNANVSFYRAVNNPLPEFGIEGSDRFSWTARLNMTFNVWKDGSFQLIGNYNSPRREVQELDEARYFADASFRQDLFKKKLSVSLRLTDIFNTRSWDETTFGRDFTTVSSRRHESRVLYLGLQYQINNFNRKSNRDNGNGEDMEMDGGF